MNHTLELKHEYSQCCAKGTRINIVFKGYSNSTRISMCCYHSSPFTFHFNAKCYTQNQKEPLAPLDFVT